MKRRHGSMNFAETQTSVGTPAAAAAPILGVKAEPVGLQLAKSVDEQKVGSARKRAGDAMGGLGESRRIDAAGLRPAPEILQDRDRLAGFDVAKKDFPTIAGLRDVDGLDHACDAMATVLEDGGEIRDDFIRRVIVLENQSRQALRLIRCFKEWAGAHDRRRRIWKAIAPLTCSCRSRASPVSRTR